MATNQNQPKPDKREHVVGLSEAVVTFLDTAAKVLVTLGAIAGVIGIGILVYTLINAANAQPANIAANVGLASRPAIMGLLAVAIGIGWLMWGEEIAGPMLVIIGLALLFAPAYVGYAIPANDLDKMKSVIDTISASGAAPVIIGLIMIVGDLASRMRVRIYQGARAEYMKYGQGVREERDTKNVFLGKCWQLPYCRKFVRERCPIYHAKRTCWKERVGCMCEEQVIRNAMQDVKISKDALLAAKAIPKNNTLTPQQKKARCNQCIIYNEHQKHKYRAMLPAVGGGILLGSITFMDPATQAIKNGLKGVEKLSQQVTNVSGQSTQPTSTDGSIAMPGGIASKDYASLEGKVPYAYIIYFTLVLVGIAYSIRMVEYLIFKHKI